MCAYMRKSFLLLAVCNPVVVVKGTKLPNMARCHILEQDKSPETYVTY